MLRSSVETRSVACFGKKGVEAVGCTCRARALAAQVQLELGASVLASRRTREEESRATSAWPTLAPGQTIERGRAESARQVPGRAR